MTTFELIQVKYAAERAANIALIKIKFATERAIREIERAKQDTEWKPSTSLSLRVICNNTLATAIKR